jgi:hypothetical protein
MNKERELLKECRLMLDNPINGTAGRNLQIRITELIAQPEQEQEPVAWMYEWDTTTTGQPTCKYVNMGKDKPNVEANFLARNFIPLYTVPQNQDLREALREALREGYNQGFNDGKYLSSPKREPLSNEQKRLEAIAIKQREVHGIGEGEELMKQIKTNRVFYQEGYAQAELDLKREPLSNEEIAILWGDKHSGKTFMVRDFAREIEKAHGIGVDDE